MPCLRPDRCRADARVATAPPSARAAPATGVAQARFLTRQAARAKLAWMTEHPAGAEPHGRWRLLAILATAQLLAFAPWFSASAVAPLLQADWALGRLDLPFLTIAVQLGFAAGALVLAATGAADVVSGRYLLAAGAVVAAIANVGFAWLAHDVATALPFRVATGAALACVYPIAIKVLAGWFGRDRVRGRRASSSAR